MAHDLASLITVVDGILIHPTDQSKKELLESLREKATSLMSLVENYLKKHHLRGREVIEALQSEIRDAAHEAEDIMESHVVDLKEQSTLKVMEKFDAANDKLIKIITEDDRSREEGTIMDLIASPPSSVIAADPTGSKRNIAMVGFDTDALHLKYRLTSSQRREREIVPIVGMGGIGKTTLALHLYDDPLIVEHFDVRAWATVSQDYNVKAILLGLLSCILEKITDGMQQQDDDKLGVTLHKELYGRRYLVVLDDVWSKDAWDEIRRYLPTESSGSRILITSRELDVAKYPDSTCEEHQMHLLSEAQGWDLLRQKVFDAEKVESCPPLLEEIGRKIVSDCGGLPLAISVIGGLLSVDKYSKDLWEQISGDVRAVLSQGDEHFSKILSLSYDNLPLQLKPCFLYMAAFPEDFKVRGSKLVKLWAAEGFLRRPSGNNFKSLEELGEEYLKALVDRNLLHVLGTKSDGRPECYGMHDLLRVICVRKADDEKFFRIVKDEKAGSFRRVAVHPISEHMPHLKSANSRTLLLMISRKSQQIDLSATLSALRLLRILDLSEILLMRFPREILKLVNLRFLAIHCLSMDLPSEIWTLRNLQALITHREDFMLSLRLSTEAWEVPGLRHIVAKLILIGFKITGAHENLQTICYVSLSDFLDSNLIYSIPNVRKLGIRSDSFYYKYATVDLTHMLRLETLKFSSTLLSPLLPPLKLPKCLKKLAFEKCTIPVGLLNDVSGALQNLEVLKIIGCKFHSEEHKKDDWVVDEEVEFCSLQYLELDNCRVMQWKADCSNFPTLRHLKIHFCPFLEEFPENFGEILTLEMIEVDLIKRSQVAWAKGILETQHEYGNDAVELRMR